ncbi:hypothetical protein BN1723_008373 [Verticillium longisporum]|uniref:Uncharacterized protein n=1 Tax=Verticillium longisporum TaxID=100787 RepID=A0A0G4NRV2_VERLO|nr:hypothetical protein BN1723_008373 [Verticillium longisporum]
MSSAASSSSAMAWLDSMRVLRARQTSRRSSTCLYSRLASSSAKLWSKAAARSRGRSQ